MPHAILTFKIVEHFCWCQQHMKNKSANDEETTIGVLWTVVEPRNSMEIEITRGLVGGRGQENNVFSSFNSDKMTIK